MSFVVVWRQLACLNIVYSYSDSFCMFWFLNMLQAVRIRILFAMVILVVPTPFGLQHSLPSRNLCNTWVTCGARKILK